MNSVILSAILSLISLAVPGANSALVQQIIQSLIVLVPVLVQEAKDLIPMVQQIIELLRGGGNLSTEQIDALDVLSTQCDAAFDAADAKAAAEDAAADGVAAGTTAQPASGDANQ